VNTRSPFLSNRDRTYSYPSRLNMAWNFLQAYNVLYDILPKIKVKSMTASDQRSCLSVLERKDLTVTDALLPADIFKPSGLKTIFEYIQMCLCATNSFLTLAGFRGKSVSPVLHLIHILVFFLKKLSLFSDTKKAACHEATCRGRKHCQSVIARSAIYKCKCWNTMTL